MSRAPITSVGSFVLARTSMAKYRWRKKRCSIWQSCLKPMAWLLLMITRSGLENGH
ncbi:Uncharacterised protein [Vibrio cholerae]|nr:Uncharacterised protein [Vibrio cholerae]